MHTVLRGKFDKLEPFFLGSTGTKVMITTGEAYPTYSSTKTEVVDVVSGKTCADLADFPFLNKGASGANLHGIPVVCGGRYSSGTYIKLCYKFTNAEWQKFAVMKEKRGYLAGIILKNKYLVSGGSDGQSDGKTGSALSKTTELISIDGEVEYGPEIPEAVYHHAITSINSSVSILSGGTTSTNYGPPLKLTWYYNHETNVFSSGPSLLQARDEHGSATIVDKVTKEKIPMVTGGYSSNSFMESTELLINGMWQSGTIQCPKKATLL